MPVSYVLINVEPGSEMQVLNEVRKVPNVRDCHRIYGLYDMIAKVEADSMDGLKEWIEEGWEYVTQLPDGEAVVRRQ